jgi:hypothetical protein
MFLFMLKTDSYKLAGFLDSRYQASYVEFCSSTPSENYIYCIDGSKNP